MIENPVSKNVDPEYVASDLGLNCLRVTLVRFSVGALSVRRCWVNFQCRDVQLIRIRVGQVPTLLAEGADVVVWTFLSRLSAVSSFSVSLEDGPI